MANRCDWRIAVTDLESRTVRVLDLLARNRAFDYQLGGSCGISFDVPSGDPRVSDTWEVDAGGDGFPVITEGDRLIYAFRRDYLDGNGANDPWTCRAAGTVMLLHDKATADASLTTVNAYDPWQRLYYLPVWNPFGGIQGRDDVVYTDTAVEDIIIDLLFNANVQYTFGGSGKVGIDWGQFPEYSGTIESLPNRTITFQKEMTIGDAFDLIVGTDVCDIILTPVYDPVNRPGILAELNVYARAGIERPTAIFAWDRFPMSVVSMDRQIDGTQRSNTLRFHAGQGGSGDDEILSLQTNGASIERFGAYWRDQFITYAPENQDYATAQAIAHGILHEFGEGKRSVSFDVMPERCPEPFIEFALGDLVKVWSSREYRAAQSGYQRLSGFTVEVSDDSIEMVKNVHVYIPPDDLPIGFNANVGQQTVILAGEALIASMARRRPISGSWGGR